jgi:hypothetical protein
MALPTPYEAISDSPNLVDVERNDLAACEAAIDSLRVAFWAAGKALQVVRDARLYRGTHATFEEYVEDRWQMSRAYAYRLIQAWPLAEALSPIGDKIINESQVRELIPLASHHGTDAAVTVYRTVVETNGVRVTADVLKGAVSVLPRREFDPEQAVEQIRAYLAGLGRETPAELPAPTGVDAFAAEAKRVRTILRRVVKQEVLRSAASENPDQVRKLVAELRALLDEVEQTAL